ncbi:hypothetical protein Ga0102493_111032 [Erythrobacter litoralis]|jgi:hypothetical protein|uniref:Uncharacterized protein n=1 Tax=Erythrobacter litoralis TaxID=39960 RepID=A0A074MYJ3_9SPHN|nr:hypothetical protein [Erythrobacter litoralis]AOL22061.1 hypothetical protein Ga0102493_111032 [Erythrobacter litoralis]KEO90682.1 hypothetical protein EH32_02345 [Erythrobacter litoralis]MEE4338093.1 hypothetical protein [Erythrobacter sp.]
MFEKANSIFPPSQEHFRDGCAARGEASRNDAERVSASDDTPRFDDPPSEYGASGRAGDALRAIDWAELNARLGAARDLRVLLRRDAHSNIESNAASFGDAAARYFAALEQDERPVNPDHLEARKASRSILGNKQGDAATGDARDD